MNLVLSKPIIMCIMDLKRFNMPAFLDLTGKIFGRLTVIKRHFSERIKTYWECKCECGNISLSSTNDLRCGDKKSCGCLRKDLLRVELTGQKFGKLTVIQIGKKRGNSSSEFWDCKCECGNPHTISSQHLREGAISSCGCMTEEDIQDVEKFRNEFFNNVEKTSTCWNWKGRQSRGYGLFNAGKLIKSHRFSYILHNGIIPNGKIICHICDNPKCVNPEHLYAGTYKNNAQDRQLRGRSNRPKSLIRR